MINDSYGRVMATGPIYRDIAYIAYSTVVADGQHNSWWRHQMETFSALLAICAGNSPVPGEFPAQRPVTRSFDVFVDLRPNKRLSKQWWGWWFETPSSPLRRHCNVRVRTKKRTLSSTYVAFPVELYECLLWGFGRKLAVIERYTAVYYSFYIKFNDPSCYEPSRRDCLPPILIFPARKSKKITYFDVSMHPE